MVSLILITAIALPVYWAFSKYTALRKNIAAAEQSGLPYFVAPVFIFDTLWLITHGIWLPLFRKLPESIKGSGDWIDFITPDWPWKLLYDPFEKHGDTFLVVSPFRTVVWTSSAEAIHQITSQRDSFVKPLENYKVLDLYGRNVVTTEGLAWRMHRKAASPGFNEKNSSLVFKESIAQTQGMLRKWTGINGEGNVTLKEIPMDTMRVTLHIISRIGFGVRLLWEGESLAEDEDEAGINFGNEEVPIGYTMSFEHALSTLLDKIIFVLIAPRWLLRCIPVKNVQIAVEAFDNWGRYMKDLYDQKVKETQSADHREGMDIMGSLVRSQGSNANAKGSAEKGEVGLTESNIIGNSFVMLLAGHETTANTIHFALVELATNPSSQRRLQKDIDSIFGKIPASEWDYDRDINKCLGSMIGAVLNEQLRIMPPVICIPKAVPKTQPRMLTLGGKRIILPANAFINLNACGVQRSPKYWPSSGPSKISGALNDLNDFVPERWLIKNDDDNKNSEEQVTSMGEDFGGFNGPDTAAQLYRPVRGSFVPFSDGPRSCLGRRFAQVEVIAVLAVIFQTYSIELAVDEWVTDEEVDKMTIQQRRILYQKAQVKSRETIRTATSQITLKLQDAGAHIPLRLVRRGDERFVNVIN